MASPPPISAEFTPVVGLVVWANIDGSNSNIPWPCLVVRRVSIATWRCRILGEHPVHSSGAEFDVEAADMEDLAETSTTGAAAVSEKPKTPDTPDTTEMDTGKAAKEAAQVAAQCLAAHCLPRQLRLDQSSAKLLGTTNELKNAYPRKRPRPVSEEMNGDKDMVHSATAMATASTEQTECTAPVRPSSTQLALALSLPQPALGTVNIGTNDSTLIDSPDGISPISVSCLASSRPSSAAIAAQASLPSILEDPYSLASLNGLEANVGELNKLLNGNILPLSPPAPGTIVRALQQATNESPGMHELALPQAMNINQGEEMDMREPPNEAANCDNDIGPVSELLAERKRRTPKIPRRQSEKRKRGEAYEVFELSKEAKLPPEHGKLNVDKPGPQPVGSGDSISAANAMVDVDVAHDKNMDSEVRIGVYGKTTGSDTVVIYGKSKPKESSKSPADNLPSKGTVVIVNGNVVSSRDATASD